MKKAISAMGSGGCYLIISLFASIALAACGGGGGAVFDGTQSSPTTGPVTASVVAPPPSGAYEPPAAPTVGGPVVAPVPAPAPSVGVTSSVAVTIGDPVTITTITPVIVSSTVSTVVTSPSVTLTTNDPVTVSAVVPVPAPSVGVTASVTLTTGTSVTATATVPTPPIGYYPSVTSTVLVPVPAPSVGVTSSVTVTTFIPATITTVLTSFLTVTSTATTDVRVTSTSNVTATATTTVATTSNITATTTLTVATTTDVRVTSTSNVTATATTTVATTSNITATTTLTVATTTDVRVTSTSNVTATATTTVATTSNITATTTLTVAATVSVAEPANPAVSIVKASVAHSLGYYGQSVTIGMVGSGFFTTHPLVAAGVAPGFDFQSGKPLSTNPGGAVLDGQGVLSIAPQASLMPLQVGTNRLYSIDAVKQAFRHAVDNDVPVIFNEFGSHLVLTTSIQVDNHAYYENFFQAIMHNEIFGLGYGTDNAYQSLYADFSDIVGGEDTAVVWAAGDEGWNSETGFIANAMGADAIDTAITVNNLTLSLESGGEYVANSVVISFNQVDMMGLAPLYEADLLGNWVVAVATDFDTNTIARNSNACGRARFWCLAAPGLDNANLRATRDAAAHVSGALAVLRSRYPSMPMNAILAIMFNTATDLGAPGVDEIYGHGLLNLAAAITTQGVSLVVDGASDVAGSMRDKVYFDENGQPVSASLTAPSVAITINQPGYMRAYYDNSGLTLINVNIANDHRYFGQGVTIGMVGVGFDVAHPRLSANVAPGYNFQENNDSISFDADGGGTPLAGYIAAARDGEGAQGVASSAKIMPLQAGDIGSYTFDNVKRAWRYAMAQDLPIVFNEFGVDMLTADGVNAPRDYTEVFSEALELQALAGLGYLTDGYLRENFLEFADIFADEDTVVVWAAGDAGWNGNTGNIIGQARQFSNTPASVTMNAFTTNVSFEPGVVLTAAIGFNQVDMMGLAPLYEADLLGKWLVVAAVENNADNDLAAFSNACGRAMYWCVTSPGNLSMLSTETTVYEDGDHEYDSTYYDGTDAAAAMASGALAVLRSRFPSLPMNALLAILFKTATDMGAPGVDEVYGHGLINLGKAVTVQGSINLVIAGASEAAGSLDHTVTFDRDGIAVSAWLRDPAPIIAVSQPGAMREYYENKGLTLISVNLAHDRGYYGQGVTVGLVGSGVDVTHPRLSANMVAGYNFQENSTNVSFDVRGGGTQLAGFIAAARDGRSAQGVASDAKVMPLYTGDTDSYTFDNVKRAWRYAMAQDLPIVLNQFGVDLMAAPGSVDPRSYSEAFIDGVEAMALARLDFYSDEDYREQFAEFAEIFADEDTVVVWHAGEEGWNSVTGDILHLYTNYVDTSITVSLSALPIEYEIVPGFTVSASISFNQVDMMALAPLYEESLLGKWVVAAAVENYINNDMARFSNGCGRAMHWCVTSPGNWSMISTRTTQDIDEFYHSHGYYNGTDAAAAHLAGALAVLKSRFPAMPMNAVLAILFKTATDMGAPGVDEVYGHGLINVGAAATVQNGINLVVDGAREAAGSMRRTVIVDEDGLAVSAIVLPARQPVTTHDLNAAEYNNNPGLRAISANMAHDRGYFGQDVAVGIVGRGFDVTHPQLSANVVPGYNFLANTSSVSFERDGVGTPMAGFVGGVRDGEHIQGVAPHASLMPLQVGEVGDESIADVTRAFGYAAGREVPILLSEYNSRLVLTTEVDGSDVYANSFDTAIANHELFIRGVEWDNPYRDIFADFSNAIGDADMVVVWSTGDNGWNSERTDRFYTFNPRPAIDGLTLVISNTLVYEAHDAITLSIGVSHNQSDILGLAPLYEADLLGKWLAVAGLDYDYALLSSSNACGRAMHWCITAPGGFLGRMYTTATFGHATYDLQAYGQYSGTRVAAAHVSGALAVLKSRFPTMPMNALMAILFKTATDLGAAGVDEVYGHGLLNLGKAITVQGGINLVTEGAKAAAGVLKQTVVMDDDGIPAFALLPTLRQTVVTHDLDTAEYYNNPGLSVIRANTAHDLGYFGQGVTVGIIGRGFDVTHPQLSANVVEGYNYLDFSTAISFERDGAGTPLAGFVAGVRDGEHIQGVAPLAKLMPLQIADEVDAPTWVNLEEALYFAAFDNLPVVQSEYGSDIFINRPNSDYDFFEEAVARELSDAGFDLPASNLTLYNELNDAFAEVREAFSGEDSVVVWATGDNGWNSVNGTAAVSQFGGQTSLPGVTSSSFIIGFETAAAQPVSATVSFNQVDLMALAPIQESTLLGKWVAVAATDYNDNTIADFSNACGRAMHWCLAAPGAGGRQYSSTTFTYVNADRQGYGRYHGTQFAAAHVTGALAVMRSRFPDMPMSALLAMLFKTATDLGDAGVDEVYGHGLLNLGAAITLQGSVNLVIPGAKKAVGLVATAALVQAEAGATSTLSVATITSTAVVSATTTTATTTTTTTATTSAPTTTGVDGGLQLLGLSDTHFAAGFSGLAREMSGLSVAVSYLGGEFYYDAALDSLTDIHADEQMSLGEAAADMFAAPQRIETAWGLAAVTDHRTGQLQRAGFAKGDWRLEYDICTDCERSSWQMGEQGGIGSAIFGEDQQGLGASWSPMSAGESELEVFSAMGLGADGERETYRQYGLRWQDDATPAFSWLLELSEIHEDGAMLGNRGDVLGLDASQSRQVRLALSGEFGGWQWQGGMTQGWTDSTLNGTGLLTEVSDIRYRQWHIEGMAESLLSGGDEFRFGVVAAPQVRGNVRMDYFRAADEVFIPDFQYSLPTGVVADSTTVKNLSDDALILRAGYKWRVSNLQDIWAAVGMETVHGGASDGAHRQTFELRWRF